MSASEDEERAWKQWAATQFPAPVPPSCPCRFAKDLPDDPLDRGASRFPSRKCVRHQPDYWPRCDERRDACWKHRIDLYYDTFGIPYCAECEEESVC